MKYVIAVIIALIFLVGISALAGMVFGWVGALSVASIFICICLFYLYRTIKILNSISAMPEGTTAHAEYFCAHIKPGMSLIKVTQIAQAIGKRVNTNPLTYTWEDMHHRIIVTFNKEKVTHIEIIGTNDSNATN